MMQTRQRIESIDIIRGLVIALMTADHVREFFFMANPLSDPMHLDTTPASVFFSRWLAHFCAPIFIFLAGLSAYLYGSKENITKKDLSLFLLTRGLFLVALEWIVINFAWTFTFPPTMVYLQVIWAIGLSMIALAALLWLPFLLQGLIAVALIAGHHLLPELSLIQGSWQDILWSILYDRNVISITDTIHARTSYPVLPWIGVITLGYLYGRLFTKTAAPQKRRGILLLSALASAILFTVLRYWNIYGEANLFTHDADTMLNLMSFFNVTKYPPSLQFNLMVCSAAFFLLYYCEKTTFPLKNIWQQLGRAPLFYYILHLYTLHIVYTLTSHWLGTDDQPYSVEGISIVWIIAIATLMGLYPLVTWFDRLKSRHPSNKWLKLL